MNYYSKIEDFTNDACLMLHLPAMVRGWGEGGGLLYAAGKTQSNIPEPSKLHTSDGQNRGGPILCVLD